AGETAGPERRPRPAPRSGPCSCSTAERPRPADASVRTMNGGTGGSAQPRLLPVSPPPPCHARRGLGARPDQDNPRPVPMPVMLPEAAVSYPDVPLVVLPGWRALMRIEQILHVVGMLLFHGEDAFQHHPRARIVVPEVADQLPVMIDRDALGDQVFLDHVDKVF